MRTNTVFITGQMLLVALFSWSTLAAAEDCPLVAELTPPVYPLPPLQWDDNANPVDPEFVTLTLPWREYAAEIRAENLQCQREGDMQSWFRGQELVRQYWQIRDVDVYLKDGQPHYIANIGEPEMKAWEYFEAGKLRFTEFDMGSFGHYYLPTEGY